MTFRHQFRTLLAVATIAVGMLAGPQIVRADEVDDAQRKVDQVLDELDNLRDQMGQIDEDYSAALDRQEQLATEIAASQARIDELHTAEEPTDGH